MSKTTRRRLERLIDDLLWLSCDADVPLEGEHRDAIGELRHALEGLVDAD